MDKKTELIIDKLHSDRSLTEEEYAYLIEHRDEESTCRLASLAVAAREQVYGRDVFIRGLIEISNYCKNDCFYCGIRRSNKDCERYRLGEDEILRCCEEGYDLGFRTFVLQGGEDAFYTDERLCGIIRTIKERFPECAVTLSLGERSKESYRRLYEAGADRYLLRHETADEKHYASLHPSELTLENRMRCLKDLQEIGYQTGCGFMVGSPGQTVKELAKDLRWIETFKPAMCGIGPFIPHKATRYADMKPGSVELTCYLLSVIRLIQPNILLPATTALATLDDKGQEKGILAGANVIMPNLSPMEARSKYRLYDNKAYSGTEAAQNVEDLKRRMEEIGYKVVTNRGDIKGN
ncbi:MAG: [FeFe] hydrogenase H-cluster radical SAM maturase HydE [Lachnospiraceae bacterium]|nr:[FeFe] hydrogenase H-cluster radical SAM maturase HydE [Lachnospiraceae bacterium]